MPEIWRCVTTGKTREEVERNITEAVEFHLENLSDHYEPIPSPGTWTTDIEVDVPDSVPAPPLNSASTPA